ncbi:DUF4265 domain-containing protein [Streptomyces subrutilus]|uniref:DUF4265 domain-containing protein n=1 Tax=Streptomyces subrutilus TaxID=36818 RepID=UPI0033C8EF19
MAPFGLAGQTEQLWLKPLVDGTSTIACTPFCTYGLALGDRVLLSEDDQVTEVIGFFGQPVLRMFLMPSPDPERLVQGITRVKNTIKEAGLLSEWNGERHVAVAIYQTNPRSCSRSWNARSRTEAHSGSGTTPSPSLPEADPRQSTCALP